MAPTYNDVPENDSTCNQQNKNWKSGYPAGDFWLINKPSIVYLFKEKVPESCIT